MRYFRTSNPIQVYFLTDASKIFDETTTLDIHEAEWSFRRLADKRQNKNDRGDVVMKWMYGPVIKMQRIEPVSLDIADFNKRFGNL